MVMNRCLVHARSLCDLVLRDAAAVHAEYLEFQFHSGFCPKIGNIRIHCSSGTADDRSNLSRSQTGIILKCPEGV